MSAIARRTVFRQLRAPLRQSTRRSASGVTSGAGAADGERKDQGNMLKKGAKKDPELYVRAIILSLPYPNPTTKDTAQQNPIPLLPAFPPKIT